MKRVAIIIFLGLVVIGFLFLAASYFKRTDAKKGKTEFITLNYYRFGESGNALLPQIQEYAKKHPKVKVVIRDFYDLKEYEYAILNELAEGSGPDLFSMPNDWIYRHQKKIVPLPLNLMSTEQFRKTFVDTADRDLIRPDPNGVLQIYGLPFFVDSLAVFYNKDHFEDRLAVQGWPASTWTGFLDQVFQLSKIGGTSFSVAGAAIGRADNITTGVDILYALMLQLQTKFFDKNNTIAIFGSGQKTTSGNISPGVESLALYSSFGQSSQKQYAWSRDMADSSSPDQEIATFARGKVSMIFGYSRTYQKILDAIAQYSAQKLSVMNKLSIRVAPFPQSFDPAVSPERRVTLARYFAETVSHTSRHPQEAWDLLLFLSNKQSLETYHQLTKKPTSRRDMIEDQKKDPLFGVFAEQSAYAVSAPLYDNFKFHEIFTEAIQAVTDGQQTASSALKDAEKKVQNFLPARGFLGPGPYFEDSKKKNSSASKS